MSSSRATVPPPPSYFLTDMIKPKINQKCLTVLHKIIIYFKIFQIPSFFTLNPKCSRWWAMNITSNINTGRITAVSAVFVLDIVQVRRCIGCSSFCYLITQNLVKRCNTLQAEKQRRPLWSPMHSPHVPSSCTSFKPNTELQEYLQSHISKL